MNDLLDKFVEDGFCELGNVIDDLGCDSLLQKVNATREFSSNLFLDKEVFHKNPQYRNKNPKMGGNNLAEKFDLRFIEENPVIQDCMSKVLGPDYNILLKKFIVAIPLEHIPDWIKKETKDISSTNLGPYIKPEYADMTYFVGVDFHQDLIDHKDRLADFVTLYVYLDDVRENMSPLVIAPHSHIFGVTTFPHNVVLNDGKKTITYDDGKGHSDKFQVKTVLGQKGSVYFWTSLSLHGTKPSPKNSEMRISLRYLIEKNRKSKRDYLIDKLNQQIKGPLSSSILRIDEDEVGKTIVTGNVLNKQL
jgi:hypothetical protein